MSGLVLIALGTCRTGGPRRPGRLLVESEELQDLLPECQLDFGWLPRCASPAGLASLLAGDVGAIIRITRSTVATLSPVAASIAVAMIVTAAFAPAVAVFTASGFIFRHCS